MTPCGALKLSDSNRTNRGEKQKVNAHGWKGNAAIKFFWVQPKDFSC
jgi:hypothetical protein